LYEVAASLTDGTVVLDAFQPEDASSHLAGEDEEQARRFGWRDAATTTDRNRRSLSPVSSKASVSITTIRPAD